jgi:hypothetical protein
VQKIQVSLESHTRVTGASCEDRYAFSIIFRSIILSTRNVQTKAVGGKKHSFYAQKRFFFRNSCRVRDVEKYNTAGQATDDNMAHAHCMLGT